MEHHQSLLCTLFLFSVFFTPSGLCVAPQAHYWLLDLRVIREDRGSSVVLQKKYLIDKIKHILGFQSVLAHLLFNEWKNVLQAEMRVNDPDLPLTRGRQMTAEQTGIWSCTTLTPFSPRNRSGYEHNLVVISYFFYFFFWNTEKAGSGNCQNPTPLFGRT